MKQLIHLFTLPRASCALHCWGEHIPNPRLRRMLFIMIIDGHCNSPLFCSQHVDGQSQTALKAYDVIARNGPAIKTNTLVG